MDAERERVEGHSYRAAPDFVEDANEPLLHLNESTELWLLNLPSSNDLLSDIDGQELSLKLDDDGQLATFHGSSGKVYDFLSVGVKDPDEIVFVPSATEPKIGKIKRRVSVVHYCDPKQLENLNKTNMKTSQKSAGTSATTSSRYFPMRSGNLHGSHSEHAASSRGSRPKSSLSEVGEPLSTAKRSIVSGSIISEHVTEFSHGHSTGISSMSHDRSHGGKSKRRKVKE